VILLTALVSGCATPPTGVISESLITRNAEAVLSYRFQPGSHRLSEASRKEISQFLKALRVTSQDMLVVSVPQARGTIPQASRVSEMRAILAPFPARIHFITDGSLSSAEGSGDQGIIRLIRPLGVETDCQSDAGNFACANAANLAAMLANPADIMLPTHSKTYQPKMHGAGAASVVAGLTP